MSFFGKPEARYRITATDDSGKAVKSAKHHLTGLSTSVSGLATKFAAMAGIGGFGMMARGALTFATDIQNMSDRLGVSTDFLQAWQYAAEQVGIQSSQSAMGLQRFSRRLAEAAQGKGELKGSLEDLGISAITAEGAMRPVIDVLRDYADAIAETEDPQERLRLAFKAFDSEGAGLVTILKGGAAGLDDFQGAAEDAGAMLDTHITKRLADANQAFDNFKHKSMIAMASFMGEASSEDPVERGSAITRIMKTVGAVPKFLGLSGLHDLGTALDGIIELGRDPHGAANYSPPIPGRGVEAARKAEEQRQMLITLGEQQYKAMTEFSALSQ